MSLQDINMNLSCLLLDFSVSLKRFKHSLKRNFKILKKNFYGKLASYIHKSCGRQLDRFNKRIDKRLERKQRLVEKFWAHGGEYEITQNLNVKMSMVRL